MKKSLFTQIFYHVQVNQIKVIYVTEFVYTPIYCNLSCHIYLWKT